MADIMEDRTDLYPHRARLWELIHATPHLDWLLLTKRPTLYSDFLPAQWVREGTPIMSGPVSPPKIKNTSTDAGVR